ncbi:MAG: hypothetical protein ACOCW2_04800 [Chitinivibrionales bacterium]
MRLHASHWMHDTLTKLLCGNIFIYTVFYVVSVFAFSGHIQQLDESLRSYAEYLKMVYFIVLFMAGFIIILIFDLSTKVHDFRMLFGPLVINLVILLQGIAASNTYIEFVTGEKTDQLRVYTLKDILLQPLDFALVIATLSFRLKWL